MLRWVIALLLFANAGYFLWTQGHLAPLGLAPTVEHEPERLKAQIRPELQRLLDGSSGEPPAALAPSPIQTPTDLADTPGDEVPDSLTPAPAPAPETALASVPTPEPTAPPLASENTPAPTPVPPAQPSVAAVAEPVRACWQAGSFTEAQADRLRLALPELGLPTNGWQLLEGRSRGRWIVYMGRYDNLDQLERKKAELRALKVEFRTLSAPNFAPGLALGTFSSEDAAQQWLQKVARDGVRSARVAQERAESINFTLRLPAITPAQRAAVAKLGAPLAGKTLQACD